MDRNYVALPFEYLDEMEDLTDTEFGRLARALLKYAMTGEEIALSGNERFFAKRVMNREDRFRGGFEETSKKRSESGKKGAQARWKNNAEMANDGKAMAIDGKTWQEDGKNGYTKAKAKANTNTKEITPKPPLNSLPDDLVIDNVPFRTFWELYPRKEGERYANGAFATAMLAEEPEVIIAGLKRVIALRWSKLPPEEQQFIPKAEKWLKGMCWKDDVKPYTPRKTGKKQDVLPAYYNPDPHRKSPDVPPMSDEEMKRLQERLRSMKKEEK